MLENIQAKLDSLELSAENTLTRDGKWVLEFFEEASKNQLGFKTRDTFLEMVDRVVQTLTANADPLHADKEPSLQVNAMKRAASLQSGRTPDLVFRGVMQNIANMVDVLFHGKSKEHALRHSEFYRAHGVPRDLKSTCLPGCFV